MINFISYLPSQLHSFPILFMLNKQQTLPMRYATISPSLTPDRRGKYRSLIQIKEKPGNFNTSLTKYRSIRELRRRQESQKTKTQRNTFQYQRNKPQNNSQFDILKNTDIIQIIKLKLHDHQQTQERVKTEYMNRSELKHYIKKKKTIEFINNQSLDLIKSMFPKKIDLIINQLKLRRTQEKETIPHGEIVVDLKTRPKTANQLSSIVKRSRDKIRIVKSPVKSTIQPAKATIAHEEVKEVSGWDFDPLQEQLLGLEQQHTKRPKSKARHKK